MQRVEFFRKSGPLFYRIETGTCSIEQIDMDSSEITRDTYKPWLVEKLIKYLDPSNEKEFFHARLVIGRKLRGQLRNLPTYGNDWLPPPGPALDPDQLIPQ